MDIEVIMQFIGSVGFPIVMCLILFKYIEKQSENHKEETKVLEESISNNTKALTDLSGLITVLSHDITDIKQKVRYEASET